jgi:impB/mucB/samB family
MLSAVAERLGCPPASLLSPPRNPARLTENFERVIVHIDMDCFFASVAVRDNPRLRGKPVVVCHAASSGNPSDSGARGGEISSATYEARAFGVRAGMFLGEARRLCPQIEAVPYEYVCGGTFLVLPGDRSSAL